MSFKLAEFFVDITTKTGGFTSGIASVKSACQGLSGTLGQLSNLAKGVFAGLAAGATFAIKSFADAENQEIALRSALASMGQEVEANMERLSKYASALQLITKYDDDAIKGAMAMAVNLGVTADSLEDVTKIGIGLAQANFGGDLEQGMKAAAMANEGNFNALRRLLPALKNATTAEEMRAIVQRQGNAGFKQAQEVAKTFSGVMLQLWGQIGNVAEELGEALVPSLKAAMKFMTGLAQAMQNITPHQAQQIVKWGAIAMAVAGVIALAPSFVAFSTIVVTALKGIGIAALAVGKLMIVSMLSPFGLIIAGIAGVVTAIAYFAGAGDTAGAKIIDSFKRVWDFLKLIVGNTSSLSEAWSVLLTSVAFLVTDAWINAKNMIIATWLGLQNIMSNIANAVVDTIASAFTMLGPTLEGIWNKIGDTYKDTVRSWGDAISEMIIRSEGKAAGKTEKEIQADLDYAKTVNPQDAAEDAARGERDKELNERKDALRAQLDKDKQHRDKIRQEEFEAAVVANDQKRDLALADNQKAKEGFEADLKSQFAASGKSSLGEQVEEFYEKMKEGMGMNDMLAFVDKIKAEAERLKAMAEGALSGDATLDETEEKDKKKKKGKGGGGGEDIASMFARNTAIRMAAADELKQKKAEEKQKIESQWKAKLQQDKAIVDLAIEELKETIKTNKLLELLTGQQAGLA